MKMNKIFVAQTQDYIYCWIMPVADFVSNAIEECQHWEKYNDGFYTHNDHCPCYKCKSWAYDSKLHFALEREHAEVFDSFDDAVKYHHKDKEIMKVLLIAEERKANYRVSKLNGQEF